MLIKGNMIPQDLQQATDFLEKYSNVNNGDVLLLLGTIKKKMKDYINAIKYFEKAAKLGNAKSMYELGKMFLKGIGCKKSEKEAVKFLEMSKKNGFRKSEKYLKEIAK